VIDQNNNENNLIDLENEEETKFSFTDYSQKIPEESYFDKQPISAPPHLLNHVLQENNISSRIPDSHFIVQNSLESENASFLFLPPIPHVVL